MRSFTEKKLTALMIAICVIFAIGNIPQMVVCGGDSSVSTIPYTDILYFLLQVVMVLQNESLDHSYNFQVHFSLEQNRWHKTVMHETD